MAPLKQIRVAVSLLSLVGFGVFLIVYTPIDAAFITSYLITPSEWGTRAIIGAVGLLIIPIAMYFK